ncbi:MAG: alpha/beta hydrolase [Myxococcota bacterium]
MQPRSRRVPGAEGVELHLLEWSEEGVPFVLLHGFSNDAHIWEDFAPTIAPHYRTLAFDLRGHGDSDRHAEALYDYDHHLADLEAAFESLDVDRLVLCGHSFGGRVATLYAGRHPDRLAGLVIVDSAPELDSRGVVRIQVDLAERGDASFASVAEYERMLTHAYPAAKPAALARMARTGLRLRADGRYERKTDPAFHRRAAQASPDEASARERETVRRLWKALEKVTCPALVVRGAASDIFSPEVADRMVDEVLANGRLALVAQAGHSVMTDNPEGFAEAVASFALS